MSYSKRDFRIASIILAGGKGTRLFPLTLNHCKPAVSFGGRYRIIDIPISNSINSDIRQIFVIGQYLTSGLQHHLSQTYQFDYFEPGMIDFLTPEEQFPNEKIWYEGTADAVRKNMDKISKSLADYYLILSGDQLYNIDFIKMFEFARKKDADLTIASIPVLEKDASRFGLLQIDEDSLITNFYEKPEEKQILDQYKIPKKQEKQTNMPLDEDYYLASMGIYIFKKEALINLLKKDPREDFGKFLIPTEIKNKKSFAYIYNGYWEDIGTIRSFYEANLALTESINLGLKTYDESHPIYARVNHLPGTRIKNVILNSSIICEGCIIHAKEISHSVIGLRSFIKEGSVIKDTVVMGNNFYLPSLQKNESLATPFEIGENCLIEKAIIDEHVTIGNNVKIVNKNKYENYDGENGIFVRDGITIVTANSKIPDNFVF